MGDGESGHYIVSLRVIFRTDTALIQSRMTREFFPDRRGSSITRFNRINHLQLFVFGIPIAQSLMGGD